jgi:uncharacterized membrane protein YdjX (TVP38/TMEM64 family)
MSTSPSRIARLRRFLPLALIAAGIAAVFALGLDRYLSMAALSAHREELIGYVAAHPGLAAAAFMLAYALAVALSIPGATILTLTGGLLFGLIKGTVYVTIGATLGATGVFLAARTALGEGLRAKAGPWLGKLEDGFKRNALSYLLFLRLVPLFPFWLVNLVPAFLNVPLRLYILGTLLGIIPGTFIYVSVGNGLGTILDQGQTPNLGVMFEPQVLLPILALAAISAVPPLYQRLKARNSGANRQAP